MHLARDCTCFKLTRVQMHQFLPVEGDEVFRGQASRMEEIRSFQVHRPGSVYSAGSDKGE